MGMAERSWTPAGSCCGMFFHFISPKYEKIMIKIMEKDEQNIGFSFESS